MWSLFIPQGMLIEDTHRLWIFVCKTEGSRALFGGCLWAFQVSGLHTIQASELGRKREKRSRARTV